ncbi:MAG: hypothetical protein GF344_02670 [Chitinivibrionales bacterium]|nr:hypothetical protein [Chitinivibrionales bacterium]MBD3355986.1 hypothetical protein [Chitinivibrionales bacterium]
MAKRKPYYGYLEFRRRGYYLFWCYPAERESGGFGGSVVAKIDLDKALGMVAQEIRRPFMITVEGDRVYAHSWKQSIDAKSMPLPIPGLEGVRIKAEEAGEQVEETKTVAAGHAKEAAKATKPATTPASAQSQAQSTTADGFPWPIIIIVVGLALAGGVIGKIMHGIIQNRHSRLINTIEGNGNMGQAQAAPTQQNFPQQPPAQAPNQQAAGSGSYSYYDHGGSTGAAGNQADDDGYFENNATVIMPRTQVAGMAEHASAAPGGGFSGYSENQPAYDQGAYARRNSPPNDEQVKREIYQQVRQELEGRFQQELNRRVEQTKQELFAQAREALTKSVGQYMVALQRHVEELKTLSANDPARQESLNAIAADIQRLAARLK